MYHLRYYIPSVAKIWCAHKRRDYPIVSDQLVCRTAWRSRPALINAWLWVVAHSARDLTFPLLLMTSTNVVAASAIYLRSILRLT